MAETGVARATSLSAVLFFLVAASAHAQSYEVSVEESGVAFPTTYTKRYNWRYFDPLRHTTGVASSTNALACGESACLDDGEAGDRGPDGTRGGTAVATVSGMVPGRYKVEMKCRRSANRATSVPWRASTDATSNNLVQGNLDQRNNMAISDSMTGAWVVLGGTDQAPVDVQGSLSFSFGAASGLNGSLSYGGVRLTKVATPVASDAGVADAGATCGRLVSAEYSNPLAVLNVPLGSTERLAFHVSGMPNPAGLDSATLQMRLFDADHPGEEGTVFVNGHGPLVLPAAAAWGDVEVDASLSIPVAYLVAGTNLVEFGAGSRTLTVYYAGKVALVVGGPSCQSVAADAAVTIPDAAVSIPDAAVTIPDAGGHDAGANLWDAGADSGSTNPEDAGFLILTDAAHPADASAPPDSSIQRPDAGAAGDATVIEDEVTVVCNCCTAGGSRAGGDVAMWCVLAAIIGVGALRRRKSRR